VRIFLSFNSRDTGLAEAVRVGLCRIDPAAQVFFSPVSLGAGFWLSYPPYDGARAVAATNEEEPPWARATTGR
jgi:hypothetical protein